MVSPGTLVTDRRCENPITTGLRPLHLHYHTELHYHTAYYPQNTKHTTITRIVEDYPNKIHKIQQYHTERTTPLIMKYTKYPTEQGRGVSELTVAPRSMRDQRASTLRKMSIYADWGLRRERTTRGAQTLQPAHTVELLTQYFAQFNEKFSSCL